ncbi:MAG: TIGR01777 family oxidoreductase [Gammaproteobacteria bacterium]|nr:TIGR01777 family oxidoreductase [Gammaproteobacteria bacterium]
MHKVIAGATGLIGKQLVNHWLKQSNRVSVIGRQKEKIVNTFGNRVNALEWQELTPGIFEDVDLVVNLAGASIGEKLWSSARKEVILKSRLDATQHLVSLLVPLGAAAPALFNASAIGVYGLQAEATEGLPTPFDEKTPIDWNAAPDFLSEVAREWEKATLPAVTSGIRVVNLRFGVVLAKDEGALPQIARPFYFGMGGPIGSGCQPMSWVALTDVIGAIDFLSEKPEISGPVNVVAPQAVTQKAFAKALGRALHRPSFFPMPGFLFKLILGQMADELLLRGQNVYPRRLLDVGFHFSYPDLASALASVYQK